MTTGLYVHLPFCASKCSYCDFYSVPGRLDLVDAYVRALLKEVRQYAGLPFTTLYLGGGTPSLIGPDGLRKLMKGLRRTANVSALQEATLEVNPESASAEFFQAALDNGFGRVSIGVQTMVDTELRSVGRAHTALQGAEAVMRASALGFSSISVDLIAGLPGQNQQSLRRSLDGLLSLHIDHLSLYCLSLEPGTPLADQPPANLPSENKQADMFQMARDMLAAAGFEHYEISNFARSGHQCVHNLNYWRGGDYAGLGASASSHLQGRRYKNLSDLQAYMRRPAAAIESSEELGAGTKAAEEAMLRLRLIQEGLDVGDLAARFGHDRIQCLSDRLSSLARENALIFDGTSYRLHPSRVLTSNPILAAVLEEA